MFCGRHSVLHPCLGEWGDAQKVTSLELMGGGPFLWAWHWRLKRPCEWRPSVNSSPALASPLAYRVNPGQRHGLKQETRRGWVSRLASFPAGVRGRVRGRPMQWLRRKPANYLVEVLMDLGVSTPERSVGTRSCKATVLSWAHWSPKVKFTQAEHRLLGHHIKRGSSNLIYSRQLYIELAGKCLAMYRSIQNGDFDPDQTTESRVAAIAAAYEEPGVLVPDPSLPAADEEGASRSEAP